MRGFSCGRGTGRGMRRRELEFRGSRHRGLVRRCNRRHAHRWSRWRGRRGRLWRQRGHRRSWYGWRGERRLERRRHWWYWWPAGRLGEVPHGSRGALPARRLVRRVGSRRRNAHLLRGRRAYGERRSAKPVVRTDGTRGAGLRKRRLALLHGRRDARPRLRESEHELSRRRRQLRGREQRPERLRADPVLLDAPPPLPLPSRPTCEPGVCPLGEGGMAGAP
jgi:hypothetical protein